MQGTTNAESQGQILASELGQCGLYGGDFAYVAFNPADEEHMLKRGMPIREDLYDGISMPTCYAAREGQSPGIWHLREGVVQDIFRTSAEPHRGIIAVYRLSELIKDPGGDLERAMVFNEPRKALEALAAIVEVTNIGHE